jgi:hypothetical protein
MVPTWHFSNCLILAFALRSALNNGQVIETVGDAAAYFGTLSADQLGQHHWKVAVRLLDNALNQPTYLRTATMSLQTALLLDVILASPLAVGGNLTAGVTAVLPYRRMTTNSRSHTDLAPPGQGLLGAVLRVRRLFFFCPCLVELPHRFHCIFVLCIGGLLIFSRVFFLTVQVLFGPGRFLLTRLFFPTAAATAPARSARPSTAVRSTPPRGPPGRSPPPRHA